MKKLFLLLIVLISSTAFSQVEYQKFTPYFLFNVGYNYQNKGYLNIGIDNYWVRKNNDIIDIGVSADTHFGKNSHIIPKLQIGYLFNFKNNLNPYFSNINSSFWLLKTSVSPHSVTPEGGITVLSLLEFTTGYSFPFKNEDSDFKGLKLGVNLKLPFLLFWHD